MKRPLTAQEALDKFGFVVYGTYRDLPIPSVAVNHNPNAPVPEGTPTLLIAKISEKEARRVAQICGWGSPAFGRGANWYKAVAE